MNPLDNLPMKVGKPQDNTELTDGTVEVSEPRLTTQQLVDNYKQLMDVFHPRLYALIKGKSNKALQRVIKAVAEYPIIEGSYDRLTTVEREIYNIIDRMLFSKYAIVLSMELEQQADSLMVKEEAITKEETHVG